ncbi:RNA polymerase sigma factor [Streptomyces orinoci]|uniref:Sigma-70 family RNA polymerase sigma factor n=1 Tax=Streptomyces orinoci TaxID=67339 RepID=A0ABV3JUL0_STRON|nr:sigma-70 family RNA polymerase sigma factor [Streptomyces orinoci]
MANEAPPRWDRRMQQRLAHGEAAALGELYDRFASLVHGLAHRVLGDEDGADRVTRDVFGHLWEHPEEYDPKDGPLRSWLASLTHRQAVTRLRLAASEGESHDESEGRTGSRELEERVRAASAAARADYIVSSMPAPLREALDLAYFHRLDCARAAASLGVTEDETRRRLRLGLQLLSTAHQGPRRSARAMAPPGAHAGSRR